MHIIIITIHEVTTPHVFSRIHINVKRRTYSSMRSSASVRTDILINAFAQQRRGVLFIFLKNENPPVSISFLTRHTFLTRVEEKNKTEPK